MQWIVFQDDIEFLPVHPSTLTSRTQHLPPIADCDPSNGLKPLASKGDRKVVEVAAEHGVDLSSLFFESTMSHEAHLLFESTEKSIPSSPVDCGGYRVITPFEPKAEESKA